MKDIITITSKGQFTLPVEVRKLLGVQHGGTLRLQIDTKTATVEIQKQKSLAERMQKHWDKHPRPIKPITDREASQLIREIAAKHDADSISR